MTALPGQGNRFPPNMSNPDQNRDDSSLPLVIGVTGHRDLRDGDLEQLERVVRQTIENLRSDLPHTPLVLLSALAEGADRLAARVALELGVRLIVPLPMRREIYETDFSPTSRAEFAQLLGKAALWFELPFLAGATEEEVKPQGAARDRHYEQVGAYIVRQSHLLIALWDGKYRDLVGGTSRVVTFQLEGVPEPYAPRSSPIDTPESGPVYHIVTPRDGDPKTAGEPFAFHKLFPKGYAGEADRFSRICARLNTFNRDVSRHSALLAQETKQSAEYLFPDVESNRRSLSLQSVRRRFAVADTLAIYFQRLTWASLNKLYLLGLLMAIVFELYGHFFQEQHWILAVYLMLLAMADLGIKRRAKRQGYQEKYQDYRTLAEGLRVQFFWGMAGSHLVAADHYLPRQRSEGDWICGAVRACGIPDTTDSHTIVEANRVAPPEGLELVLRHWVADQATYFDKAAKRDHEKLERFEPYMKALIRIGVGVAVLVTAALLIPHPWRHELAEYLGRHHRVHSLLLALMSLPPIIATLMHGSLERRTLPEHTKQFARMSVLFSSAKERLTEMITAGQHERALNLIEELGKEALEENGDWVWHHRARPLEVPHAG